MNEREDNIVMFYLPLILRYVINPKRITDIFLSLLLIFAKSLRKNREKKKLS